MTTESITVRIRTLVAQATPLASEDLAPNARLIDDLGLTSLDLALLAAHVESEFGLRFAEGDLIAIQTVEDVVAMIERYAAQPKFGGGSV